MRNESVSTEIKVIDVEEAKSLLERNIRNRNLDAKTVSRYAEMMRRGEWRENYEPLHFSEGGVLLNGQHRLNAIVKSGVPQRMIIIRGIKDEAMDSYDRLKTRSTADIMSLHDIENSKNMSSIIKAYLVLKRGGSLQVKDGLMSNSKLKDLNIYDSDFIEEYARHGELFQELFKKATNINKAMRGLFTVSEMAAYMAYLIIDKLHLEDVVTGFFKRITDLADVENAPIFLLRDKLVKSKMGNMKIQSKTKKAYIIKTWNAFIQNRDLKLLMVKEDENIPDFV